ncbi:MAG: hypothetical protein FD187_3178, partial [bacterium]
DSLGERTLTQAEMDVNPSPSSPTGAATPKALMETDTGARTPPLAPTRTRSGSPVRAVPPTPRSPTPQTSSAPPSGAQPLAPEAQPQAQGPVLSDEEYEKAMMALYPNVPDPRMTRSSSLRQFQVEMDVAKSLSLAAAEAVRDAETARIAAREAEDEADRTEGNRVSDAESDHDVDADREGDDEADAEHERGLEREAAEAARNEAEWARAEYMKVRIDDVEYYILSQWLHDMVQQIDEINSDPVTTPEQKHKLAESARQFGERLRMAMTTRDRRFLHEQTLQELDGYYEQATPEHDLDECQRHHPRRIRGDVGGTPNAHRRRYHIAVSSTRTRSRRDALHAKRMSYTCGTRHT